ncbi:MAG: ribbon-helix-helix domain-containing protein [Candidatus Nanopusillus acidilobi]
MIIYYHMKVNNLRPRGIEILLTVPKELMVEIDKYVSEKGFRNRQDVIREILREKLKEGGN